MQFSDDSAYIRVQGRLADVVAAINAMSIYRFYKLDFKGWSDRISGTEEGAAHWERVFKDHPEFFRLDSSQSKVSLVWRRQKPKRYNVDTGETISRQEYRDLDEQLKKRISRVP